MLSFLHALILMAGWGCVFIIKRFNNIWYKGLVSVALLLAIINLAAQSYKANNRFKSDPRNPYVYAHTSSDFLNLVKRVKDIAQIHPDARKMFIAVIAEANNVWPLPWYLRSFNRVGYWTNMKDAPIGQETPLIITSPEKMGQVPARINDSYLIEYFGLRPEVLLSVYIRKDLWEAFLKTQQQE